MTYDEAMERAADNANGEELDAARFWLDYAKELRIGGPKDPAPHQDCGLAHGSHQTGDTE